MCREHLGRLRSWVGVRSKLSDWFDMDASPAAQSRLPPSKGSLPEMGEAPTESSVVRCRGSGLFRMMPLEAQDAPDDTGEGWVKVRHQALQPHYCVCHILLAQHKACNTCSLLIVTEACGTCKCQNGVWKGDCCAGDELPAQRGGVSHDGREW